MAQLASPAHRPGALYCLCIRYETGYLSRHYYWTKKGLDKAYDGVVQYYGKNCWKEHGDILWSRIIDVPEEG